MIALLSLPDAEETEKFIAEKAAEQKNVAEMTIKELREAIAEHKKKIAEQDETIAARQSPSGLRHRQAVWSPSPSRLSPSTPPPVPPPTHTRRSKYTGQQNFSAYESYSIILSG